MLISSRAHRQPHRVSTAPCARSAPGDPLRSQSTQWKAIGRLGSSALTLPYTAIESIIVLTLTLLKFRGSESHPKFGHTPTFNALNPKPSHERDKIHTLRRVTPRVHDSAQTGLTRLLAHVSQQPCVLLPCRKVPCPATAWFGLRLQLSKALNI